MKNNKPKSAFGRRDSQFDKLMVAKVIAGIVLVSFVLTGYQNFKKFDYFRVKEVILRPDCNTTEDEKNFAYLEGRNIFELDLDREVRKASYYYPSYQKIRITRFFPNHIVVDFFRREPLACIRSSRTFYIDENLILFELPDTQANGSVTVISGVDKYVLGAKYGTRCPAEAVAAALNIIKAARDNKVFRQYAIKRVDMAGSDNASIFLLVADADTVYTKTDFPVKEQIMEVKIGREDARSKITLLASLLVQVKNNVHNIEYIDLRFKEPVIKFKERT